MDTFESALRGSKSDSAAVCDRESAAFPDRRYGSCTSRPWRPQCGGTWMLDIDLGAVAYRAMWGYGVGPPSDTFELPMLSRADVDFGSNKPLARLVGEAQAELGVDLGFVGGVGGAEHGQHVGERGHDRGDLVSAH